MKKLHTTLFSAVLALTLFTGCALSTVNYNNEIVEQMKLTSTAVDTSSTNYNELLPDTVTEKTEVDSTSLTEQGELLKKAVEDAQKLMKLESQNQEQAASITPLLQAYLTAAQNYESAYQNMLTYYSDGSYKKDITQVEALDEALYEAYANFAEANNDLAEALEGFVE